MHLQRRHVAAHEVVKRSKVEVTDGVTKRTAGESCGSLNESFWKPLASPGNSRKSRRLCNRQMWKEIRCKINIGQQETKIKDWVCLE